jgi:TonB family protein
VSPAEGLGTAYLALARRLGAEYGPAWPSAERKVRMPVQSYQPPIDLTAYDTGARQKWVFRTLVAFAVLGGFVVVLIYYRWFGSFLPGASNDARVSTSDATTEGPRQVSPTKSRRTSSKHRAEPVVPPASEAQLTWAGITQSAIRSPLAVEVISGGGRHQLISTRDDAIYLGVHDKLLAAPDVVDATSPYGSALPPAESVEPVLTKQQTMEGSVMLLARIDKDGNIESLQPISGPEILFAAAREAVKQWRFKPYYESGQAIETEAQITVQFAISAH